MKHLVQQLAVPLLSRHPILWLAKETGGKSHFEDHSTPISPCKSVKRYPIRHAKVSSLAHLFTQVPFSSFLHCPLNTHPVAEPYSTLLSGHLSPVPLCLQPRLRQLVTQVKVVLMSTDCWLVLILSPAVPVTSLLTLELPWPSLPWTSSNRNRKRRGESLALSIRGIHPHSSAESLEVKTRLREENGYEGQGSRAASNPKNLWGKEA